MPIYKDLEKHQTAIGFAMGVYDSVYEFLGKADKTKRRANKLLEKLGGTKIGGLVQLPETKGRQHWQDILETTIQDLVSHQQQANNRLLFLWDEVPFMLEKIRAHEGEQTAMTILDTLRSLRQNYADQGLRMIITGSIGIHHVLNTLKQHGYANAPFNDLHAIQITPLDQNDARFLAKEIIEGEALETDPANFENTLDTIAKESDCFPFYIHHILKALKSQNLAAIPDNISNIVAEHLVHEDDPWELEHYRERIPTYYGDHQKDAAQAILDSLALSPAPMSVAKLLHELKSAEAMDNRENLLKLLRLMAQDHYLHRDKDGCYAFQFPLLRRWWHLARGL